MIFMEILSIIVVRIALIISGTGLGTIMGLKALEILPIWPDPTSWSGATALVEHNKTEKWYIGLWSSIYQLIIFLGYFQILYAFTTGGRKGHIHWFYVSLLVQHFLNSLIAGSIGFWEVGLALWYLVTLPMAPIIVFLYQMIIHSWIRSHGPRNAEYLVVEYQIWLALILSGIATALWIYAYNISYGTAELDNLTNSSITNITVRTLYSTVNVNATAKTITLAASVPVTVTLTRSRQSVEITATINTGSGRTLTVYEHTGNNVTTGSITIRTLAPDNSDTITVNPGQPKTITARTVKVTFEQGVTGLNNETYAYTYKTFAPEPGFYINIAQANSVNLWNTAWDGGECEYAEYYERKATSGGTTTKALAVVYVRILGGLDIRYFGKPASADNWKIITSKKTFYENLDKLREAEDLELGESVQPNAEHNLVRGIANESYNTKFSMVFPSPIWLPLIMQGLSVGAVGSIFPNLIPKTLTCPRTTRSLSVMNMFLVTLPHIFNVLLADNNPGSSWFPGVPWDEYPGDIWAWSLLYYIIYFLAILFAIFNVHYPEWALSTFLRNNTWMVFLMILFTDVLNETFNAISRAGICSQRAAGGPPGEEKKNHPCLHNKIACLMNLTYIIPWMTETPWNDYYLSYYSLYYLCFAHYIHNSGNVNAEKGPVEATQKERNLVPFNPDTFMAER